MPVARIAAWGKEEHSVQNPISGLLTISLAMAATSAHADARSTLFLKGVASSIAAHCPKLPLDKELMRTTKHISGVGTGTRSDYAEGVRYIDDILESGEGDCDNTCYFIRESPSLKSGRAR
jgi:hypothetical protein